MLACFLTLQGYKVYNDLSCTVPPAFRTAVTSTVMITWVGLIVYAVVQGAVATATYVRVHWQEMDLRLLSLSHLVWFAWGCLLLSGLLPSLAYGFAYMLMLPFKVRHSCLACVLAQALPYRCTISTAIPQPKVPLPPDLALHGCDRALQPGESDGGRVGTESGVRPYLSQCHYGCLVGYHCPVRHG